MSRPRRSGAAWALAVALAACGTEPLPSGPPRDCSVTVWHKPSSPRARVEIVGDFQGWRRPGLAPDPVGDGHVAARFTPPPGESKYAIVEDGVWLPDAHVATTAFHEGHEVTLLFGEHCEVPKLTVEEARASAEGEATLRVRFERAAGGSLLDTSTLRAEGSQGEPIVVDSVDEVQGRVVFRASGLARGKHGVTVRASDRQGLAAEPVRAALWVEDHPWDRRDAFVYQIVVDRYRGDDGPLEEPSGPSARSGGTLRGVTRAIEAGELERMGVTTVWLSPVYDNPRGTFVGNDGRQYSSYHGYWPIDPRRVDARIGGDAALDELMRVAHARGVRVLFDVVPNHVHEQHRYVREHRDWFGEPGCVCGQGACDWATHIRTCSFAPYMPDVRWEVDAAARAMTDDVAFWIDRFDGDGVRIDAVPMMPRAATRRIAHVLRSRFEHPGHALMTLGENFTGPGGYSLLRYDLGPQGIDGSFHFPLMWALRAAIATASSPMTAVSDAFAAGEKEWAGSGAVMGLMIGNHDVSRFASESAGSSGGDTWVRAPKPLDPRVYEKQRLALTAVMTLPGVPVLYYGDELGVPGKSDPDTRRVMPREGDLIEQQRATRDHVAALGRFRRCSPALRRGAYRLVSSSREHVAWERADGDRRVYVILGRETKGEVVSRVPRGAYSDVATGQRVDVDGDSAPVDVSPWSARVLVPLADECAPR